MLVIRAWLEGEQEQPSLRARITQSLDVTAGETTETVAAAESSILAIVDAWLEAFKGKS